MRHGGNFAYRIAYRINTHALMPRKKIKLTSQQQEQTAAIGEIEAILNKENIVKNANISLPGAATKPAKKERIKTEVEKEEERAEQKESLIIVRQASIDSRSPYLVDLNSPAKLFRKEKIAKQDIKKSLRKFAGFFNFIFPAAAITAGSKEGKSEIKKNSRSSNLLNDREKKLVEKSELRKKLEKNVQSVNNRLSARIKTLRRPAAWAGNLIKAKKNTVKNFYFKHQEMLDEIMVVNLAMLAGAGALKVFRLAAKCFFYAKSAVHNSINFIKTSWIIKLAKNFFKGFFSFLNKIIFRAAVLLFKAVKLFFRAGLGAVRGILSAGAAISRTAGREGIKLFYYAIHYAIHPFFLAKSKIKYLLKIAKNEMTAGAGRGREYGGAVSAAGISAKRSIKRESLRFFNAVGLAAAQGAVLVKKVFKLLNNLSFKFLPPASYRRQLAAFILVGLALIAPLKALSYYNIFQEIKGRVLGETEEAVDSIKKAAEAGGEFSFDNAADHFSQAAGNFNQAQSAVVKYSNLIKLANIFPGKKAKAAAAGKGLLASGEIAARAGEYFSLALNSLELGGTENISPLTIRLKNFSRYAKQSLQEMEKLNSSINEINLEAVKSLGMENGEQIVAQLEMLKEDSSIFVSGLREIISLVDIMPQFLGDEFDRRYLLIFQNNAEMRASGGFIGSYALVDFRQGQIKNIEVPGGGSYDLQGGLHKRIAAPEPLHLINSLWEFQDANWWPDWPASAKKLQWFFENGWGSSVDGVIAVDPTFFEELLKVVGEIDLTAKYGTIIDSENFYNIIQAQAERKDTGTPKEIIRDLAEAIIKELPRRVTADNLFRVINVTEDSLLEKHILLEFNDPVLHDFAGRYNFDGRIKQTENDYLAVINTNIAGGKSDRKIKQKVGHFAEITPDGSITNTVTITRTHTAQKGEPFAGVRNVNYLRVYVPLGSQLLEAGGFSAPDPIYFDDPAEGAVIDSDIHFVENISQVDEETGVKIYNEFNKTVFADWTMVDPGETITVRIKYKLPFKINSISQNKGLLSSVMSGSEIACPYSLLVQKQAGSIETDFISKLTLPGNMKIIWGTTQEGVAADSWLVKDNLRKDKFWGVLIKK